MARKYPRAAKFHRAERDPSFRERFASATRGLENYQRTEIPGAITLADAERDHILKTLEQTRWVVSGPNGAAARLGIKRSTLYFRMQKLSIDRANRNAARVQ
jgi:transcriptional regulator of acetoin/glycerol metabolism